MGKGQRILVFLVSLIILAAVYFAYKIGFDALGNKGVYLLTVLITMSFTVLFTEHFFTRPTDVVASALSFLILLTPAHQELRELGAWYWAFWGYCAFLLMFSLSSLLLVDSSKPQEHVQNRAAAILKVIVIALGKAKVIWFSFFVLCLFFYVDSQSNEFIVLFCYAALILLINPKQSFLKITSLSKSGQNEIAIIFGVQSGNSFLAKCFPNTHVERFDFVTFKHCSDSKKRIQVGMIVDAYVLDDEQWLKIVTDESFDEPRKSDLVYRVGSVYRADGQNEDIAGSFVGTVAERSTIERLRFEYAFKVPVQEGNLLEVKSSGENVLYQVVEGITGTEILESKNEAGMIVGEAVQLGTWNPSRRCFERHGWVPMMNKPVCIAKEFENVEPHENEYKIGEIPGTNIPVLIDRKSAVTHHLAVLGVTGSGKSVFSRNLIREIARDGTKVICVDFTNEYAKQLTDLITEPLILGKNAEDLFAAVDAIAEELDKFPNQRIKANIDRSEAQLRGGMSTAIQAFIDSDKMATLFELPDVTNSNGILEYTRWFFRALFDLAKAGAFGDRKVCVVLEEAHTIVPEWNFLGIEDKRSSAVVNSIAQIALQGRKYGVGFIVIAQRTANVSKTVLTQCNSVIAFQQFDRTSAEFLGNYMGEAFVASLSRLKPRHAIAVGKAFSSGTPVIFQVPDIIEPADLA